MTYTVYYSCISHIGNWRKINQDNFICAGRYMMAKNDMTEFPIVGYVTTKSPTLFGIFDGLGGEERGEMASFIAARKASAVDVSNNAIEALSRYCLEANEEICRYAHDEFITAMGTTAALLAFTETDITLCNIGDSKVFRLSKGVLKQISHDHVSVSAFGTKPPLSQNLGIPPTDMLIEPYIAQGRYSNGDVYLICSDGLTDMLDVNEIADILGNAAFENVTKTLLDRSLANGGRDNISIIVCKIKRCPGWPFIKTPGQRMKEA